MLYKRRNDLAIKEVHSRDPEACLKDASDYCQVLWEASVGLSCMNAARSRRPLATTRSRISRTIEVTEDDCVIAFELCDQAVNFAFGYHLSVYGVQGKVASTRIGNRPDRQSPSASSNVMSEARMVSQIVASSPCISTTVDLASIKTLDQYDSQVCSCL